MVVIENWVSVHMFAAKEIHRCRSLGLWERSKVLSQTTTKHCHAGDKSNDIFGNSATPDFLSIYIPNVRIRENAVCSGSCLSAENKPG